jgi:GTPase SAR1 family protein
MFIEKAEPVLNTIRVAVLGDVSVGKSTYILKLGKKQN